MNDSQKLLADYAQRGSEPAFTELVQRYVNFVYSTALRLADGDSHLAEDVTQTVFADLARTARSLSTNVMLGGWLHRHTCFVASKTLRSDRRRKTRERQAVETNATQETTAGTIAEMTPELDDAINHLSDEDRLAILLRFFEQRDFSGVGAGLGTSDEAARKRVSRAVEKLHESLTRRGVTLSAAGLGAALGAGLVVSAPAGLVSEIAMAAFAAGGGGGTAAGLKILAGGTIKLALVAAVLVAAAGTPLYLTHQTELALREENQGLQTQVERLTAIQTLNASSTVASERPAPASVGVALPPATEEHRELLRLRGEVGVLRDQLAKAKAASVGNSLAQVNRAPREPADITLSFPSIPLLQVVDIYQGWAGKALTISPDVSVNKTISMQTPVPLTKSQAMAWTESVFRDQGNAVIVTNDDGSLMLVPAPKQ
jgi:RNA polymerase sigma factor (sigma-70 family)